MFFITALSLFLFFKSLNCAQKCPASMTWRRGGRREEGVKGGGRREEGVKGGGRREEGVKGGGIREEGEILECFSSIDNYSHMQS